MADKVQIRADTPEQARAALVGVLHGRLKDAPKPQNIASRTERLRAEGYRAATTDCATAINLFNVEIVPLEPGERTEEEVAREAWRARALSGARHEMARHVASLARTAQDLAEKLESRLKEVASCPHDGEPAPDAYFQWAIDDVENAFSNMRASQAMSRATYYAALRGGAVPAEGLREEELTSVQVEEDGAPLGPVFEVRWDCARLGLATVRRTYGLTFQGACRWGLANVPASPMRHQLVSVTLVTLTQEEVAEVRAEWMRDTVA